MELGDFSPGEADQLRKNMASWKIRGDVNPWIVKLKESLYRRRISTVFIDQMVGQLRGFSAYGFPESHAASFAFIAYGSCFIKRHHPDVFLASLLNSQPLGFYSPAALIEDARRHGVKVKGFCVLRSSWETQLERDEKGLYVVRLGFHLVKKMRLCTVQKLVESRNLFLKDKSRLWFDFHEFAGKLILADLS